MKLKILVGQPKQENSLNQLKEELDTLPNVDILLFPEGYLQDKDLLEEISNLAVRTETIIITGYKDNQNKDRGLIIDNNGEKVLDRAKTPIHKNNLLEPIVVQTSKGTIGYILCMEILKGVEGFAGDCFIDFIAHPIGTGMFSENQFNDWIDYAKKTAIKHNCYIIGTSHADGSFRNCGISIPIAYCINKNGEALFISKSDTSTRLIDLEINEVIKIGK